MKNFSLLFANHIASGATTLCTCWLVERLDGIKLGFTDHDLALSFAGQTYEPAHGLEGTEIATKLGAQVDTSEVAGILHSSAISEDDILLGHYDGARVTTFRVNWRDVSIRATLRVDTIGEISREDGYFRAELRSQLQALNIPRGRRYQSICDAGLGDARCTIDLNATSFTSTATLTEIIDRYTLQFSGLGGFSDGWFSHGKARWLTGKRSKVTDLIVKHVQTSSSDNITFSKPLGDWAVIGDQMSVFAGCDRRFSTCGSKFFNIENFQGFPHIPGADFVLTYPKSSDALDGSVLFK